MCVTRAYVLNGSPINQADQIDNSSPYDLLADLGLLIFVFYFTSKNLLYYQHLLVNMEQSSKKDLDYEQVQIS